MIKQLTIKKNGVKTHGAVSSDFDSVESFDAWVLKMQELNAWGEAGGYIIEIQDITTEVEQQRINAEALAYLASTDWMIVREMETGTPCPQEIKDARAAARLRIVN